MQIEKSKELGKKDWDTPGMYTWFVTPNTGMLIHIYKILLKNLAPKILWNVCYLFIIVQESHM